MQIFSVPKAKTIDNTNFFLKYYRDCFVEFMILLHFITTIIL